MKKFKVTYQIGNEAQWLGSAPHNEIRYGGDIVEAETELEAIELYKQYMIDNAEYFVTAFQNENNFVALYFDNKPSRFYYNFEAVAVEVGL